MSELRSSAARCGSGPNPVLPFLVFFLKMARKTTKKTRIYYPYRSPKIPGKEGKNAQKSKEFLAGPKNKEFQKGPKNKEFKKKNKERKDREVPLGGPSASTHMRPRTLVPHQPAPPPGASQKEPGRGGGEEGGDLSGPNRAMQPRS